MHAAPPLQISLRRFGLWRAGLLLLAASSCAAMLAWWSAQPAPAPAWASAAALCASVAALACAGGLWRQRPLTLRWDRQRWQLARDAGIEQAGELAVAIDFGGWMLLRFAPDGGLWARPRWIALQRPGLEPQWHALRCALYAARPGPKPGAAAAVRARQ